MKLEVLSGLAIALLLAGCSGGSDKSGTSTNANASGSSPADAPAGYLGALGKAQQSAVKTVDTTSVNQAIQMFNVDKGRYPKDLNELVQEKYMPQLPPTPYGTKLEYDPAAGKVTVVKQ
jgi:hypothetical protein